jgi:hypothetical protein
MTLLEVHKCDVCGETFYVPEEPLRKLQLTESNETTIDYDLCFDCKESLFKWILSIREKK